MKRIALAGLILVLAGSAASAASGVTFGVKGGLYTANTTEVPAGWNESSFKNGFAGGAYVEYRFDETFSLQPELLYVQKGQDGGFHWRDFTTTYTANYDYIEIPLLLKYRITTKSSFIPYLLIGPALGINIAAKLDIESQNPFTQETATGSVDFSSVMNASEFSWIFGFGLATGLGPGEITFDARFDLGLSKIYKGGPVTGEIGGQEYTQTVYPGTSKNLGFALFLGYTL
jgi:hypothetical protein